MFVAIFVFQSTVSQPLCTQIFRHVLIFQHGCKCVTQTRIVDTEGQTIGSIFNRVGQTPSERRYDINSIELRPQGQLTANDYGIGGTWIYTGYSKGMHQSSLEESTLQSTVTQRDTLRLDVKQTYYRTWTDVNNTIADQLASVYFSVPNKIDKQYDELYAIDFDAYKYLSSPIFCIKESGELSVNEEKVFDNLMNQRGLLREEIAKEYGESYLTSSSFTWLCWYRNYFDSSGESVLCTYASPDSVKSKKTLDKIAWVFQVSKDNDYVVGRYTLLKYMNEFSQKFGYDVRNKYSSLLFSDFYYSYNVQKFKTVENGKNIGRLVSATENWSLKGSLSKNNIWSWLFNNKVGEIPDFCPIQEVSWADINDLSDDKICQTYFIASEDVDDFKAYVKKQNENKESVYLFRFDIDTYFTTDLYCENYGKCGYVAQEPIYLDFDIISLTYEKDNVYTVIPVVSDPIDVIAGIEPGGVDIDLDLDGMFGNLLTTVLTILFAIVVVFCFGWLVIGMLKYIFKS